jgi:hypothetical protein
MLRIQITRKRLDRQGHLQGHVAGDSKGGIVQIGLALPIAKSTARVVLRAEKTRDQFGRITEQLGG